MLIIDSKNGTLANANRLKKSKTSSLSEGDAVIYIDSVLTDIVVIKTWEDLLNTVPKDSTSILKAALEKISKMGNIVNIHLIILGNRTVFLNKYSASRIQDIRLIDGYIDKVKTDGIIINNFKSYPTIADYIINVDNASKITMKVVEQPKIEPVPKIGIRKMNTFVINSTENISLEKIASKILAKEIIEEDKIEIIEEEKKEIIEEKKEVIEEKNSVINAHIKDDNIDMDPDEDYEIVKLLWTAIPGITNKIFGNLLKVTSLVDLYNGNAMELSSVKYITGTRFGLSRARNLISSVANKDIFKLILSTIPTLTEAEITEITDKYNIGDILQNPDEIKERYTASYDSLMLLNYKK